MKQHTSFSLIHHNTFAIDSVAPVFYQPESIDDLKDLPKTVTQHSYILGEGSNTLFIEEHTPTIIQPAFKGIKVTEQDEHVIVDVAAGENWHELVCFCVENSIKGLENLALIPGSVGASPVQNIGAYGVEIADYCHSVQWFEFESQQVKTMSNEMCQFAYRDSIFKHDLKDKGIITSVCFKLPKMWQPNISYNGLNELASSENITAKQVMDKVIEIRQQKLPDPKKLANAGSFFKNPIVSAKQYQKLASTYPDMPHYVQHDGTVKLAAGWLVEQAGLKGYQKLPVGVHEKQALVLVNFGKGTGKDIVLLAQYVQQQVINKFSVKLTPEVRFIAENGEWCTENLQQLTLDESGISHD